MAKEEEEEEEAEGAVEGQDEVVVEGEVVEGEVVEEEMVVVVEERSDRRVATLDRRRLPTTGQPSKEGGFVPEVGRGRKCDRG